MRSYARPTIRLITDPAAIARLDEAFGVNRGAAVMRWGEWREHLSLLPEHMHESIVEWIELGEPHPKTMGSFLHALLTNDLMEAFARADFENTIHMGDWAAFLRNVAPIGSYGSEANLLAWYSVQHAPPTPEEPTPP